MENTTILYIIVILIVFLIALWLIKSLLKAVIAAIVIAVVFRVLWIYTPQQMINILRLEKIMSEDQLELLHLGYEDFTSKRNDFIIDPQKLDDSAQDLLQEQINKVINTNKTNDEN